MEVSALLLHNITLVELVLSMKETIHVYTKKLPIHTPKTIV